MTTKISLEFCGMAGNGRTVTEAKQDAARKLTKLVEDLYQNPEIISCGGYSKLVWRDAHGWQSALIQTPDGGIAMGGGCYGHDDRANAIKNARYHVAQNAWSHDVADDRAFAESAGLDREKIADLVSWCGWQRRYKEAIARGHSPEVAHAVAGGMVPLNPVKPVSDHGSNGWNVKAKVA